MDLKEILEKAKTGLSQLVTAENTDKVTAVSKDFDEVAEHIGKLEAENLSLKDKIVEMVKTGIAPQKEKPHDDIDDDKPKSLDEIMLEEANKIVKDNKEEK